LIAAVQGGGTPPLWVNALDAAQAWGCPPWEIAGETDPDRLKWFIRWQAYQKQVNLKNKEDGKWHKK